MEQWEILSWNVNGIRATWNKGMLNWLSLESPDIFCAQETKVRPEQLPKGLAQPKGFYAYWNYPEAKGYSGTVVLAKQEPLDIRYDFNSSNIDMEGRVIVAEYPEFVLLNIYFPNGKKNEDRLQYKLNFYDAFLEFADSLRAKGKKLIICGDVNTAHKEIDLARPKENEDVSGFLPIEREWMDKFVSHGYVDTFRYFNEDPHNYTWWDLKSRARERNVGWRLDYFFVTDDMLPWLRDAFIMSEVMGSDHCPVGIRIEPRD